MTSNLERNVCYSPQTALCVLQAQGIHIGLSANTDICVYPLAHVFPLNALLEETIRFFLVRGELFGDRRVGFQMQNDHGEFIFFILNLSEWQEAVAKDIREQVSAWLKEQENSQANPEAIVKHVIDTPELADKFRRLYKKGEAVLLGMDADQALIDKLTPLVTRAYALDIPVNFIPPEDSVYRDVHVVQDALTLLQSGSVHREIPLQDIFKTHQAACSRALAHHEKNMQTCKTALRDLARYSKNISISTNKEPEKAEVEHLH